MSPEMYEAVRENFMAVVTCVPTIKFSPKKGLFAFLKSTTIHLFSVTMNVDLAFGQKCVFAHSHCRKILYLVKRSLVAVV